MTPYTTPPLHLNVTSTEVMCWMSNGQDTGTSVPEYAATNKLGCLFCNSLGVGGNDMRYVDGSSMWRVICLNSAFRVFIKSSLLDEDMLTISLIEWLHTRIKLVNHFMVCSLGDRHDNLVARTKTTSRLHTRLADSSCSTAHSASVKNSVMVEKFCICWRWRA